MASRTPATTSPSKRPRRWRWLWRAFVWIILLPPVLLALVVVLLYLPPVQHQVRGQVVRYLGKKIGTPVALNALSLRFPVGVTLDGLLVLDQQGDTLLSAGTLRADLGLGALVDGRIELRGTTLEHVVANVEQDADRTFNFTYILRAFAGDTLTMPNAAPDSAAPMPFSVSGVSVEDLRVRLSLAPSGLLLHTWLGSLVVDMEEMDAGALRFHANTVRLADSRIDMRTRSHAPEPDSYPDLPNPFAGLDITLDELGLENVAFSLANQTKGDSLWLQVGKGEVQVDSVALERQHMRFASVALEAVRFGTLTMADTLPKADTLRAAPAWLDQHDGFRYWARGLDIGVARLALTDGSLDMHRGAIVPARTVLDPEHMVFRSVNLQAEDLLFNDQQARVSVRDLAAGAEDSTELHARFRLDGTPAVVRVEEGMLAMDNTELRFSAKAEPGDLSNLYLHPEQVPLRAQVAGAIDLRELPELFDQLGIRLPQPIKGDEIWDTRVAFSGTAQRADTLRLDVIGDQGTIVHLRGDVQDIRRLPYTAFHADINRIAMGQGLHDVLSSLLPTNVPLPRYFTGTAQVNSNGSSMDAEVALESDLGDVRGTAGVTVMAGRFPDAFDADLVVAHVPISRFTADTAMGPVSVRLLAQGAAMNTASRTGNVDLLIEQLVYHGQDLAGAHVVGNVLADSVHLALTTAAPALAIDLRTHARWPVGSDTLSGALTLRADEMQLNTLGWYPYPLGVKGQWRGEGSFSTDGFAAFTLDGDSVTLSNTERSFRFEEFAVEGHLSPDSTVLVVQTDALEVDYATNIPLDSLLPRSREKLLGFFREDSTGGTAAGERMDLRVALPSTAWLTGIMLPGLKAVDLETFEAHYDADADAFDLDIAMPILHYGDITVSGLSFSANTKGHVLDGSLRLDSARYNDIHLHQLALTATSSEGTLHTALRIQEEDGADRYVVPIDFTRSEGSIGLQVHEGLVLDTVHWDVDPANSIRFGDGAPVAEHFRLNSGAHRAELVTGPTHTTVRLEQFPLGALLNLVSLRDSTPMVAGELSGDVRLPLSGTGTMGVDMRVDELALSGQPLGNLLVNAEENGDKRYTAKARFEGGTNELDASLVYDGGQQPPAVEAHAELGLADLSFLKPFTSSILYELGGGLSGTVDWTRLRTGHSLRGDLTFAEAVFGVKRTGARYRLPHERILADAEGLSFQDLTVLDSLGNAFVLDGRVLTTDLASMRFDLSMRTDSFQLVNSEPTKDALFYGDLFAALDVRITGTDKAPVVKGDLGILAGTALSVVLPGSEVKLIDSDGLVEFTTDLYGTDSTSVASDQERLRDSIRAQLPQVDLDLRIRITDRAAFAVVLDPTTGDQATFQGNGDLRFRYDPEGRMRLTGPFVLSEGGYTLEFYGLVKKRFDLVAGSTVTWDGDPISAQMDIKARYISESAGYPLVANATGALSEAERNRLSSRLPFEVIINIVGGMKKPDIGFDIDLPREFRNSYPQVNDELDRLADKSREEERNRQVFGLLVLNSFIQDEAAGGSPSSGLATSAARSSVNGILTDQMNKLTGRYVKGVDIQLGVSTMDQAQGNATYQRTSVDYKVSKSFLNKRLHFEVGGSVGVDENEASTSNVGNTRAAQYAILYDLTRDGRFRLRGFYENAFDLYDGEITDSGIALMHTRDFEENEKAREAARTRIRDQRTEELHRKKAEREKDTDPPKVPPAP